MNSVATLVRGLKKVVDGLSGVGSYINDIVIYSDSWHEHLRTLKKLFGRLRRARITAQTTKCLLGANRIEFLGHQIGGDVIIPSSDNLEKVRKTPCPTINKCHCPTLLKKGKSEQVKLNEAQEHAYSLIKEYLLQEPVLKLPDLMKPFVLRTDASGVRVAALLLQENKGKLYPVGYASKKLSLAEAKCPIIKKECLAVVWGIRCFRLYLACKRFTLQTDHKLLKYLKNAEYQNDCAFLWAAGTPFLCRRHPW